MAVQPGDRKVSDEREVLTWELFGSGTRSLSNAVSASGYRPDFLLAIARGGVFTAGALAYALNVKLIHMVNVEFYTGVDQRLAMPLMLPPVPSPEVFAGARVLICDDVADTGATLKLTRDFCEQHVAEVRSAVLYQKSRSLVSCEYVWRATDTWITFPWDIRAEGVI